MLSPKKIENPPEPNVVLLPTIEGAALDERRKRVKDVAKMTLANSNLHMENHKLSDERAEAIVENQKLKDANEVLLYESTHDDLTGLLNKKAWKAGIDLRIEASKPLPFGVIFMDMDGFKDVNDRLGHEKGDEVLRKFGEHMRASFKRKGDVISHEKLFRASDNDELPLGRYGGDEFGIVVDLSDRERQDGLTGEQRMEVAREYASQVIREFVDSMDADVQALNFDISQGAAVWDPNHPISSTDLIRNADESMYKVKVANGRPAR